MRIHPYDTSAPAGAGAWARALPRLLQVAVAATPALAVHAAEPPLPLCPAPEETVFACPLRAGGGLQVCTAGPGEASAGAGATQSDDVRVIVRELGLDGSVQWSFGSDLPPGEAYRANFLTNGALTLAHLRFEDHGVEHVLIVGEDQTQGLAGLARATAPGSYEWRMCGESWKSRLDYRFYGEARIPADPVAAPLP